jgi:hypothetical protein
MVILFFINLFVLFFILSIPCWPVRYLKIGVYLPLLLSIIWIVYDECEIIKLQTDSDNSFIEEIYLYIFPSTSVKDANRRSSNISIFILLLITDLGFFRLQR